MFSLLALYLNYRKQGAFVLPADVCTPAANDRMQAAALPIAA